MSPEQQALLDKAHQSLEAARSLHAQGYFDFAASRAYYAMFYLAEAFLLGRGLAFSKHSAVISAFGKEFAKTQLVPPELHGHLRAAEASRMIGDYETSEHVSQERSSQHLRHAEEFLAVARRLLGEQ